jgi:hypothetical protein
MSKACSECKETKDISLYYKGRSQCKECYKNKYSCIHGIRKVQCRECGGSQICKHNIQKAKCRECGGSAFCIHNIQKVNCRECGGSAFCIHNIQKTTCRECRGSAFCIHNIQKTTCRDCGGSAYCIHNIQKVKCISCRPECACTNCKGIYVDKRSNCYPICQACFCNEYPDHEKSTLYKIKERYLMDELRLRFPENNINMIFDKAIDGGCSKKRPDVLIDLLLYCIIIECDENQHKNYECENKRTMQLFEDLGNRPLIMIRFNPDIYTENKKKIEGCFKPLTKIEDIHKKKFYEINKKEWERRLNILEEVIREKIREDIPEKEVEEIKLFYDYK